MREADWKLIGNTRDTTSDQERQRVAMFLANLRDDPGERTNLAEQHPDIVVRLEELHKEHLR